MKNLIFLHKTVAESGNDWPHVQNHTPLNVLGATASELECGVHCYIEHLTICVFVTRAAILFFLLLVVCGLWLNMLKLQPVQNC